MEDMSRRRFLLFAAFSAASLALGGCAAKTAHPERPGAAQASTSVKKEKEGKKKKKKKEDPRIKQPWPAEYNPPNLDDSYCFIPRFVFDKNQKDGVARNAQGKPLIEGLSSPYMQLAGDSEKRVYQTVFDAPITPDQLGSNSSYQNIAVATEEEELKEIRAAIKDANRKKEQILMAEQAKAFDLATNKIRIADLEKRKADINHFFQRTPLPPVNEPR